MLSGQELEQLKQYKELYLRQKDEIVEKNKNLDQALDKLEELEGEIKSLREEIKNT